MWYINPADKNALVDSFASQVNLNVFRLVSSKSFIPFLQIYSTIF